jgi:hypothetical protein
MSTETLTPPPPAPAQSDDAGEKKAAFMAAVVWIYENFGLFVAGERHGRGMVTELKTRTAAPTAIAAFSTLMLPYRLEIIGPRGGVTRLSPVNTWLATPGRVEVAGFRTQPDKPWPTFIGDDGKRYINLYLRPTLPEDGDASLGHEFLQMLLPDEREQAWFRQWLGHKLRFPAIPGPSIVMVAQSTFGVGRSTLYKIMADMFGREYVGRPDFADVVRQDGQAVYNDWIANSVLALINEAASGVDDRRYQNKRHAYEKIKELVDTSRQVRRIKGKYEKLYQTECGPGFIIASNQGTPLAIVDRDRRLTFLTNGEPREPEFYARIAKWRAVPGNIGAFRRDLEAVDLTGFNAYTSLPTTLKDIIAEDSYTPIDEAAITALEVLPGQILQLPQVVEVVTLLRGRRGWHLPNDWQWPVKRAAQERDLYRIGARDGANWHPKLSNKDRAAAYARSREAQKQWTAASPSEVMAELQKNETAIERLRKTAGRLPPFTIITGTQPEEPDPGR